MSALEYLSQIARGVMDDGEGRPFVPGVNCWDCGRFVGRDGHIEIEYFELSTAVASVSGQCAECSAAEAARDQRRAAANLS